MQHHDHPSCVVTSAEVDDDAVAAQMIKDYGDPAVHCLFPGARGLPAR